MLLSTLLLLLDFSYCLLGYTFFYVLQNPAFCDYAYPWQVSFQDPASPVAEGIVVLHHDLLFILTIIGFAVGWLLARTTYLFYHTRNPVASQITHGTTIEIVWTVTPSLILMVIAIPSFALLYSIDEVVDPSVTLKVIGHQWFWSYEYSDMANEFEQPNAFDSYMVAEDDLEPGQLRLLEVDNRVVLPVKTHIRVLVTSSDVLHSWAVPSLGVKMDACPGRLNQVSVFIKREGVFYGQCSELCGVNHAFMPIVVEGVPIEKYIRWVLVQTESTKLTFGNN
ncbi:cytochrome c oxidase subunit 2 (mitochondrion) [Hemiselmis andersenii]|uniref:Cytochrome c oxidase subunit 2 n=1 Tax=Hemiselmis andersenii TaxID=464988 RepID=B2MWR9_HEMAN|nr:cytochrome c oxidase subunit 2 [Hemiselmis andersenii]ACC78211.1 cytochrome c oxidase subunit 2 [Hemiselmis andersenii]